MHRESDFRQQIDNESEEEESSSSEDEDNIGIIGKGIKKKKKTRTIITNKTKQDGEKGKNVGQYVSAKNIDIGRVVSGYFDDSQKWAYNEHNPDYNLTLVNSSNTDFQSKLNTETGSYFLSGFIERIRRNDEKNCCGKQQYLSEIFGSIQQELHARGTQLPEDRFFNHQNKKIVFVENAMDPQFQEEQYEEINEEMELVPMKSTYRPTKPSTYSTEKEGGAIESKERKIEQNNMSEDDEEVDEKEVEFNQRVQDIWKNKDKGINQIIHHFILQKDNVPQNKQKSVRDILGHAVTGSQDLVIREVLDDVENGSDEFDKLEYQKSHPL